MDEKFIYRVKDADGTLISPINIDETGALVGLSSLAWTGTLEDGTHNTAGECAGWTSQSPADFGEVGSVLDTNFRWTRNSSTVCNINSLHLYCFQQ